LRSAFLLVAVCISVVVFETAPLEYPPPPEPLPPPTEAEMELFCSRYEEVKDLSFSEMSAALVDYAPDDIRGNLISASEQPLLAFRRGQGTIYEFISRCSPVANVP
jgi:hypothetical protein